MSSHFVAGARRLVAHYCELCACVCVSTRHQWALLPAHIVRESREPGDARAVSLCAQWHRCPLCFSASSVLFVQDEGRSRNSPRGRAHAAHQPPHPHSQASLQICKCTFDCWINGGRGNYQTRRGVH